MTVAGQSQLSHRSSKDLLKVQSIWSLQRAGGPIIFIIITIAYVIQTELTQAVQKTYHKPYFLLYLTHSGYALLLPIHLLVLKFFDPSISLTERIAQIRELIIFQFNYQSRFKICKTAELCSPTESHNSDLLPLLAPSRFSFKQESPWWWIIKRCIQLTLFLTVPALCWYASVPFADMTSITAIFNTNSCFAYVFSVWFLESEKLEFRRTVGVIGSLMGAMMISWSEGSSSSDLAKTIDPAKQLQRILVDGQRRWLGIGLALLGSIGYALYEVWYKKCIVLPNPSLFDDSSCRSLTSLKAASILSEHGNRTFDHQNYHGIEVNTTVHDQEYLRLASVVVTQEMGKQKLDDSCTAIKEKPTNLAGNEVRLIYSNFITTMAGLITMSTLWLPIPILNRIGLEEFEMVQDRSTAWMILGIVIMGVTFNAGFMILLGLWGPVISSVGNLCALILIAIVDKVNIDSGKNDLEFDLFSFIGSFLILTSFFILIYFEKQK